MSSGLSIRPVFGSIRSLKRRHSEEATTTTTATTTSEKGKAVRATAANGGGGTAARQSKRSTPSPSSSAVTVPIYPFLISVSSEIHEATTIPVVCSRLIACYAFYWRMDIMYGPSNHRRIAHFDAGDVFSLQYDYDGPNTHNERPKPDLSVVAATESRDHYPIRKSNVDYLHNQKAQRVPVECVVYNTSRQLMQIRRTGHYSFGAVPVSLRDTRLIGSDTDGPRKSKRTAPPEKFSEHVVELNQEVGRRIVSMAPITDSSLVAIIESSQVVKRQETDPPQDYHADGIISHDCVELELDAHRWCESEHELLDRVRKASAADYDPHWRDVYSTPGGAICFMEMPGIGILFPGGGMETIRVDDAGFWLPPAYVKLYGASLFFLAQVPSISETLGSCYQVKCYEVLDDAKSFVCHEIAPGYSEAEQMRKKTGQELTWIRSICPTPNGAIWLSDLNTMTFGKYVPIGQRTGYAFRRYTIVTRNEEANSTEHISLSPLAVDSASILTWTSTTTDGSVWLWEIPRQIPDDAVAIDANAFCIFRYRSPTVYTDVSAAIPLMPFRFPECV